MGIAVGSEVGVAEGREVGYTVGLEDGSKIMTGLIEMKIVPNEGVSVGVCEGL